MSHALESWSSGPRSLAFDKAIAAHLATVLSSKAFKDAESLRQLLRFTVEETLAGRGDALKEYVLAVTVLRKGESFDPKADGIVRVQMRRLREHLARYYATEGHNDALRIDIPKGAYTPAFHTTTNQVLMDGVGGNQPLTVGREKELADLRAAFDSAAAGAGSFCCFSGEPGIGKTTVVETLLHDLRTSGAVLYTARGCCSERLAGSEAYLPLLEALEDLLRVGDGWVDRTMSELAPHWHALAVRVPEDAVTTRGAEPTAPASQELLKRELVTFIDELCRRQTVVFFLDDLHWADASTIDVLSYWANRCRSQRALIVGTYRPAELLSSNHPFLRAKLELQAHGICRDTEMPLLTTGDVDRYLQLRFPGHMFPSELSHQIHERTEGNPLFMTDLVRFLRDRGALAQREGRWTMMSGLAAIAQGLPESIRSMIAKKLGDLRDDDRQLLRVAAIQGQQFDAAIVAAVLQIDMSDAEQRLESLDRLHGLVRLLDARELPDRTFTLRYAFVHVLYQNALDGSVRPTARASWSAAIARTLIAHFGAQCDAIAAQLGLLFEAARDFEAATEYFLVAAQRATAASANKEAVVLARRGLERAGTLPDTPARAQLELRLQTTLGPALMTTIGYGAPEVEAAYLRASELCASVGESRQLFTVVYGLYQYWLARADYAKCRQLAGQLLALAGRLGDPALLLPARTSLGNTCCYVGEFAEARRHAEELLVIYVPHRHHALATLYSGFDHGVANYGGLAVNLWALGYPDQAVRSANEGLALARDLSHASSTVLALNWMAMVYQHRREPEAVRQHADAAIALAQQELGPWLAWATVLRGWAIATLGKSEAGIAELRRGLDAWIGGGLVCLQPYFLSLLCDAYVSAGDRDAARSVVTEALAITHRTGEGYAEAELHRLEGQLQPDSHVAARSFHDAIAIASRQQAKSLELRAAASLLRLELRASNGDEARRVLEQIYGTFTEGFDTHDLRQAAALL